MTPRTLSARTLGSAAVIGFASGLRSAVGIASFVHARFAGTPNFALADSAATFAIVGEAIADKLPVTPSRLQMPGLLARVAAGGLGAHSLTRRDDPETVAAAIVIGSVAALAGSYAGATYRSAASRKVPPIVAALAEDVAAYALAYTAVINTRP